MDVQQNAGLFWCAEVCGLFTEEQAKLQDGELQERLLYRVGGLFQRPRLSSDAYSCNYCRRGDNRR